MNDISTERAGRSASLTWYGQAGFRLAAGDSRVLIDPFLTGRPDRRYRPPAAAADFADVTLVLCTHEHVDHLDLPFLREFCAVNSAAPIVVPLPVVEVAAAGGIDRARLAGAVPGEELHDRDVTVHPVPALHGIGGDEPVVYEFAPDGGPVRFLGYVLEIGGIRFYHSGDCLVYPELPGTLVRARPRRADDPHQRPRPHARGPRDRRQHERDRSRLALRAGRPLLRHPHALRVHRRQHRQPRPLHHPDPRLRDPRHRPGPRPRHPLHPRPAPPFPF